MTKGEQLQKNAFAWMNKLIKADKTQRKAFGDNVFVCAMPTEKEIMIHGLIEFSIIVGIPYTRVDWVGNKHCNTNHDEVYFYYDGYKFYELVSKRRIE